VNPKLLRLKLKMVQPYMLDCKPQKANANKAAILFVHGRLFTECAQIIGVATIELYVSQHVSRIYGS
jgi:hypothetical protein